MSRSNWSNLAVVTRAARVMVVPLATLIGSANGYCQRVLHPELFLSGKAVGPGALLPGPPLAHSVSASHRLVGRNDDAI